MKVCNLCNVEQPESAFYLHKRDGLSARCKTCANSAQRAAYRSDLERSREKARRQVAIYRSRHPELLTKEARRADRQRHYQEHREAVIAKSRQWRKDHPGASWKMVKAWMQKNAVNRERFLHGKVVKENRRRDRAGRASLKPLEIREMLDAQNWQCAYCHTSLREVAYELEHRTPLSRGGATVRDNLCMACAPCNRRKRCQTAEEFQAA